MKTLFTAIAMLITAFAIAQSANNPIVGTAGALSIPSTSPGLGPAITIDNGILLFNSGATTYPGASVSIAAGGNPAGDLLSYVGGALPVGVTGSYDPATQVLTFTGTATAAQYQALLRTVTIQSTAAPSVSKAIDFSVGSSLFYPGTGHYYEFVASGTPGAPTPWTTAKAAAATRTLFGLQGYLATITSLGENSFIVGKLARNAWMGASDDYLQINGGGTYANQAAAEGHWYWVTGPEAGENFSNGNITPVVVPGRFMRWGGIEPNNAGGAEHYGEIYIGSATWNDLGNGGLSDLLGYVVEYGGLPGDPAVNAHFTRTLNYVCSFVTTPSASITSTVNTSCPGSTDGSLTVTASGGGGTYTYAWAPSGGTAATASGLSKGSYMVTVTDQNGCSTTATGTVGAQPDNTPPTIVNMPANMNVSAAANSCNAVVTFTAPTMTDNCTAACNVSSLSLPGYTPLGTYKGHQYFISNGFDSWTDFEAYAESKGGHLATVTSSDEQGFLLGTLGVTEGFMGLTRQSTPGFVWITGEPFVFTSWCGGEPNNAGGSEFYGVFNFVGAGCWNDAPNEVSTYQRRGIIEFDCGIYQSAGPVSGSTFPIGPTTVSFTASDGSRNIVTQSFTVTVTDNVPPVVRTKSASLVLNSSGTAAVTPADVNNGSTDNCNIASMMVTPSSFSCSDLGTTAGTLRGNMTVDNAFQAYLSTSDNVQGTLIATGNDWPTTYTVPATALVPGNTYYLHVKGTDLGVTNMFIGDFSVSGNFEFANGLQNLSTNTTNWHVNATGFGNAYNTPISRGPNGTSPWGVRPGISSGALNIWDPGNAPVVYFSTPIVFNRNKNTVILTVTDNSNNSASAPAMVTVLDNEIPVLVNVPANTAASCDNIPAVTNPTATDNCGAVVHYLGETSTQDPDNTHTGHYNYTMTLRWDATDPSNNHSLVGSQTITVSDGTNPTVTPPASVTINCQDDPSIAANGTATGTDNCSPVAITATDMTTQTTGPNAVEHYNYTITRTWKATDVTGNFITADQIITVHDVTAPVITVPADVTLNCQDDTSPAVNGLATATDNCSPVAITHSDLSTQDADINVSGHYNYTITRTWKAMDVAGNFITADQIITVHDVTAPVITAPADVTVNCQDNTSPGSNGLASATDNCSPVAITHSDLSTQDADINTSAHYNYMITRTWRARDVSGNFITAGQVITVHDVTAPVITSCPASVIQCNNQTGNNQSFTLTATDNCSPVSISYSITGATPGSGNGAISNMSFNEGLSTIAWTVTDVTGNANTTCITTVLIRQLPVASYMVSTPDAFCNAVYLTGASTHAPSAGPLPAYVWYRGATIVGNTQTIHLGLADADGLYTVKATDDFGCTSNAAVPSYNYIKANLASSYVLIASKEVKLHENSDVLNGSVGVTASNGKAKIEKNSTVNSPGSFVKAADIDIHNNAIVLNPIYSPAVVTLPPMLPPNPASTSSLGNYVVTASSAAPLYTNYKDLTVNSNVSITLGGNLYRNIKIKKDAVVTFSAGSITLESLDIDEGVTLLFTSNTNIMVKDKVKLHKAVSVNPTPGRKLTFYVSDPATTNDNEKFDVDGEGTLFTGNVVMPAGKLHVHGGGNNPGSVMTGLFIAEKIESDGKNVTWQSFDCGSSIRSIIAPVVAAPAVFESYGVMIYPNPTSGEFNVQFERVTETADVRISDMQGRLVAQRRVELQQMPSVSLDLSDNAAGIYLIEVRQGELVHRSKIVLK